MEREAKLFELKAESFDIARGVELAVVMFVPLLVLKLQGSPQYWLSFVFAILIATISDPGRDHPLSSRLQWMAGVAMVGALSTALAFALGGKNWVPVAVAAFALTLLSGLSAAYGKHVAKIGYLLTVWLMVSLYLPRSFALVPWPIQPWAQALAFVAGGVLWMAVVSGLSSRHRAQQPPSEPPPKDSAMGFSQNLIVFSLLRATSVAIAVAIAWGFNVPEAFLMPVAALLVMKPGLHDSVFVGVQRVIGTLAGALVAAAFLTFVHDKYLLALVIVVFAAIAGATKDVNLAVFCTFLGVTVLTALGIGQPGNLTDNWERVAWTLVGVLIGLGVIILAGLLKEGHGHIARVHKKSPAV